MKRRFESTVFRLVPARLHGLPAVAIGGGLLVGLFYLPVLSLWWGWDDWAVLFWVHRYTPFEYFFVPRTYGAAVLFCPWQYVPYEAHYRLFALEPGPFYLQQMVAVWILLLVTYLLVRRWISQWMAFMASCLAVISAPVATTVIQLMDVHYLHGLIFTVLAVHMYLLACDRQKLLPAAVGAGLYLLAMAAKEIYVATLLPLAVWPLPNHQPRRRWISPFIAALMVYAGWRTYMLDNSFATFGEGASIRTYLMLPVKAVALVLGENALGYTCLALLVLLAWPAIGRQRERLVFFAAVAIAAIAPLVPIAERIRTPDRTLSLVAWIVCVVSFIVLAKASEVRWSKAATLILAPLLLITVAHQSRQQMDRLAAANRRGRATGEFMLTGPSSDLLYAPHGSRTESDIARLRQATGLGMAPGLVYDPLQLEQVDLADRRIFVYDPPSHQLRDVTKTWPRIVARTMERTSPQPLSVSLRREGPRVHWQLGPYADANYALIVVSELTGFRGVGPRGAYSGTLPAMDFVVRYTSPEGWITYSDLLHWPPESGDTLSWRRSAD